MGNPVADTQSVLDKLVAGVNTRTAQKSAKLTPTKSEQAVATANPLSSFLPSFPYDDPQTMLNALKVARVELVHVLEGIDALLVTFGGAVEGDVVPQPDHKAAEKAADVAAEIREAKAQEKAGVYGPTDPPGFAAGYATQQAEAQAAAFRTAGETPVEETKAERIARLKAELEAMA